MKKLLLATLMLSLCTLVSGAEVAGVQVPDTATDGGKTLKLNGAGLRKKAIFKVYVAGLYVENPMHDAAALLSSNQVKSMSDSTTAGRIRRHRSNAVGAAGTHHPLRARYVPPACILGAVA